MRKALELALSALENERLIRLYDCHAVLEKTDTAVAAIREALAAPQGEPVLHRLERKEGAAWIPASEWETGDPRTTWKELALVRPDQWRIGKPIDGKTFANALGKALPECLEGRSTRHPAPALLTDAVIEQCVEHVWGSYADFDEIRRFAHLIERHVRGEHDEAA